MPDPRQPAEPVAFVTYTAGRYPRFGNLFMRDIGCMWGDGEVTVLHAPDHGDDCRALFKLTPDAADALAAELTSCARWTRERQARHDGGAET